MPRIVLAEFNTHRVFSRNSASSRAIPVEVMLDRVMTDPYIPEVWTRNQAGMQGQVIEDPEVIAQLRGKWLVAAASARGHVRDLLELGLHKQTTNRLLEPFMWHTVIVTATEWSNFFHLRCHPDAHPAIRNTAQAMREALDQSDPAVLEPGEWHLPLVSDQDNLEFEDPLALVKLSAARCARVSYLTHDGVRDPAKDIELHDRLLAAGHMSPFEHPAQFFPGSSVQFPPSNFAWPWVQYRKMLPWEHDVYADPTRKATSG